MSLHDPSPSTCCHRPSAPTVAGRLHQAKRALLPPLCSLVSTASAHCPSSLHLYAESKQAIALFALAPLRPQVQADQASFVKFLVHTPSTQPHGPLLSLSEQARASPSTTDELPSPPKALVRGQPASSLYLDEPLHCKLSPHSLMLGHPSI